MDLVIQILWFLTILGLAAVFGGFFHQIYEKNNNVTRGMFIGAMVQLVAFGIIVIYGLTQGATLATDTIILLLISIAIAVLAFVFRGKKADNLPVWGALGVLSALFFALQFVW